jgi:hypothetical protein
VQLNMTAVDSSSITIRDPLTSLKGGYDIHVHYIMEQHALAFTVYKTFLSYLALHNIRPTFTFFYDNLSDFEGGPHKGPLWTVQLMGINPSRDVIQEGGSEKAIQQLGIAVAWLMLNRQGLKILIHSNVAMPFGDLEMETLDHTEHTMWMGLIESTSELLDLEFFDRLAKKDPKDAAEEAVQRLKNASLTSNAV